MADLLKHNSDENADNRDSQSGRGQEVERSKEHSLMTISNTHSTKIKDVLRVILCFALTATATPVSSNFLTRGRQYFVPDAAMHIMICVLSFSGIICLVILIIGNVRQGRKRVRSQSDDGNSKRHAFGSTEKVIVMYVFAFGTLFHILLRIVTISDCIQKGDTEGTISLVMYVSLAIFSLVQLLFFRKYNGYRCTSLRFQIRVILVVCANVSVYLNALIQEIVGTLNELSYNDDHNQKSNSSEILSDYIGCYNSSLARNIEKVSNFLYPFVVEFSLLAIKFVWLIWAIPLQHGEFVQPVDIIPQIDDDATRERVSLLNGARDSLYRKLSKCKCSLTISLIICVSTAIVTFVTYFNDTIPHLHSAFVVMELIFSVLLFSSCGAGLLRLGSEEDQTKRHTSILGNYVSFFLTVGSVSVYHMFAIISSLTLICNDAKIASSLMYLGFFTEIFHLLAAYLQSLFLGKCSRRTSYGDGQRQQSILRMCVFIAIANASMWIENSFLPFRKVDDKHLVNVTDSEFYGVTGWVLMSKILYPFCIYFRLDSVIRCLEIIKRI